MTRAAVMTIGDEILSGRIVDTNGALIASKLRGLGIETVYHLTCEDGLEAIERCLRFCHDLAEVIITTGGLGPTEDDVTHEAVARYAGVELELRDDLVDVIRQRFESRNVPMPPNNERSATLPAGSRVVKNDNGTAPGCITEVSGRWIISLPGVPREMAPMLDESVLPFLREALDLEGVTRIRVLKTFGFTESRLGMIVSKLETPDPSFHLGYRPTFPEIHLALTATGADEAAATAQLDDYEARIREVISKQIWGGEEDSFAGVVGHLLEDRGWTLATAESCTGGLVSKMITDVPGSSGWFDRGFTTYTNEAKQELLGVSPELFVEGGAGAVSERCAIEMAAGARREAGVDVALSTTGVAGPTGGTLAKPVGTVFVGLSTPEGTTARAYRFPGERDWVRTLTAYVAIERLRRYLLGLGEFEPFTARADRR